MIGVPVDRATTGHERLYRAFEEFVDPATYRGDSCERCLVGQTAFRLAQALGDVDAWLDVHAARYLAERFGVPVKEIMRLYEAVSHAPYDGSYEAAMALAKERFAP